MEVFAELHGVELEEKEEEGKDSADDENLVEEKEEKEEKSMANSNIMNKSNKSTSFLKSLYNPSTLFLKLLFLLIFTVIIFSDFHFREQTETPYFRLSFDPNNLSQLQ